jgi:acyl-CoA thioester hydrolase
MPKQSTAVRFVESRLRVRYKETDQMSVAHHSNYFAWFEVGRTDLCREAGISYRDIEGKGWILVVVEASCRFRVPFGYDDLVVVRTSILQLSSRSIRFRYELFGERGKTLHADGQTSHFWLRRDDRRPAAAPEEIAKLFSPFAPAGR